jgi:hypothetical protein
VSAKPESTIAIDKRYRKARAMSEILKEAGVTPDQVFDISDEQWLMIAAAATAKALERDPDSPKVHPPHSEATKATIEQILRRGH